MSIKDLLIKKLGGYTRNEYSKLNNLYETTHKEKEDALEEIGRLTYKGKFDAIARNLLIAIGKYEDKEIINCDEENYNNVIYIAYQIKCILENYYKNNLTNYEEMLLQKWEEMQSLDYKRILNEKMSKGYEIFQEKEENEKNS